MAKDISVMVGDIRFNFRVACLIEYEDKILLHRNFKADDFWNLVGGRVKTGEDTKEALIRELEEELGYKFTPKRLNLIQINELFFEYDNINCHELNFMYHIKMNEKDEIIKMQDFVSLDNNDLIYHWFNKKEVNKTNIKCLPEAIYELAKRENFDNIVWATEKQSK